jgi:hypothetical protein
VLFPKAGHRQDAGVLIKNSIVQEFWLPLKQWQGKILLALAGIIISLVVVEMGLRFIGVEYPVFYEYDPQLGIKLRAGVKGCYTDEGKGYVTINSDGLRDREHQISHPANTLRIAVLGDSYADALQVDLEETFWAVMEKALEKCDNLRGRKVEVINFGQSGFGTSQELLALQYKVWKYSPDVVLLAFTSANDVADNSRALKKIDYLPYHIYQGDKLVLDDQQTRANWEAKQKGLWQTLHLDQLLRFRTFQVINHAKSVFWQWWMLWDFGKQNSASAKGPEAGISDSVYREPTTEVWKDAWRVTEGVLLQMRDEVAQRGVQFFVVTVTIGDQVNPDIAHRVHFARWLGVKDLFYTEHRLKRFCQDHHIPILLLAPTLGEYSRQHQVYLHGFPGNNLGTGHWNQAGHRLAGETIATWLCPQIK